MGMREYKESNRLWALRFAGLEVGDWRIELRHEYVEFLPLGKGTPLLVYYNDLEFKAKFTDITKQKAELVAPPFIDTATETCDNLPTIIADCLQNATKEQSTMSHSFFKLFRSETLAILNQSPNLLALFILIARRSKWKDCPITGLKKGEAMIGDYEACGLSYPQYRWSLSQLTKKKIIATRTTNKGTIATIIDTTLYDQNEYEEQRTELQSNSERHNKPVATNYKDRTIKKDNKNIASNGSDEPSKPKGIRWSFEQNQWEGIADKDLHEWRALYSECHVDKELLAMKQWILSNPSKTKNKTLWRRFITGWLSREQEKLVNRRAYSDSRAGNAGPPIARVPPQDNRSWATRFDHEDSQWCVKAKAECWEAYALTHNANISLKYDSYGFRDQVEGFLRKAKLWKQETILSG